MSYFLSKSDFFAVKAGKYKKNANLFDPIQELHDIMIRYDRKGLYNIYRWGEVIIIDRNIVELLIRRAEDLGFVAEKNKTNTVYRNSEAGIVLILSGKRNKNQFYTIVSEKHYDEEIKGYAVKLNNKMENEKLVMRPAIWKNGEWIYLWKFDYPNVDVDHITMSHLINTKEVLRPCTSLQNSYNKSSSKENKEVFSGMIKTEKTKEITELLKNEGIDTYQIDVYDGDKSCAILNIGFPAYEDEKEFHRVLKLIRDCIREEYQYDLILACETVFHELLYLEWKFFGTLTEEEHRLVKIYLLSNTQDGRDKLKNYGFAEGVL